MKYKQYPIAIIILAYASLSHAENNQTKQPLISKVEAQKQLFEANPWRNGTIYEKPTGDSKKIKPIGPDYIFFYKKFTSGKSDFGMVEALKDTTLGPYNVKNGERFKFGPPSLDGAEGNCYVYVRNEPKFLDSCEWNAGNSDRKFDTFKIIGPPGDFKWYLVVDESGHEIGWYNDVMDGGFAMPKLWKDNKSK